MKGEKIKRYVTEMANDIERKFPYKTSAILRVRQLYSKGCIAEMEAVKELLEIYHTEAYK